MRTLFRLIGTASLAMMAAAGAGLMAGASYAQTEAVALVDNFQAWSLSDYEATGKTLPALKQAPAFDAAVAAGTLPPLEERLPAREDVMVVQPRDSIGTYGGTVRYNATNPQSFGNVGYSAWDAHLTGFTTNWEEVYPDVARSIELAPDSMSATVTLRKGMKWSDGAPVTADDILFFFNDIGGQGDLPPLPGALVVGGEPTTVEKIDQETVKFSFAAPNPAFIITVARAEPGFPLAPKHYLQKWHKDYNPDAEQLAIEEGFASWVDAFVSHQAGQTGDFQIDPNLPVLKPWKLREVDQFGNQYYERNPYYWKVDTEGNQLPYLDEQVRMLVSDPEVVKLNVQSGQLDYADKFTTADLPVLKAGEQAGGYTTMLYTADLGAIVKYQFNITVADEVLRPIFNDVRFREAMSVAVNRQEINDTIFFGLGVPRQWGVSSQSPFYEDWMGPYFAEYDVEKANALLDEMGLTKGADGIRLRPDGQPLRIVLSDAINRVQVSELVAEYWTAVGVPTQVNTVTRETFQQAVSAGQVQASVWFADVVSEKDMFTRPFWFRPPYGLDTNPVGGGLAWRQWELSNGAEGEEPPPEYKAQQELVTRWQQTTLGSEEYYALGKEVVGNTVKQMLHIGTVGEIPYVYTRSNRLMNFPSDSMLFIDHLRGGHSEQWYLAP
ncbi:MAG: ABC transporter substrate-binding protein [Cypionkella sp.]